MSTNDVNVPQPQPQFALSEMIAEKRREAAYAESARRFVPDLEDVYVRLLQDWENLFAKTAEQGQRLLNAAATPESPEEERQDAVLRNAVSKLLGDARAQSDEFARQLGLLQEHSAAVRSLSDLAQQSPLLTTVHPQEQREPSQATLRPHVADEAEALSAEPSWRMETASHWSNPLGVGSPAVSAGETGNAVPIGGHSLPPLPYPYNALEPWIDEKTMRIHHDKHHQSYVNGLNNAEKKLEAARKSGDFELVKHWERELAFHGAGHYLHTIFWPAMSPKGGGQPSGALADEMSSSFGSYNAFKKQFSEAADKAEGGGWAILVWSPRSRRLEILTAEKHQNLSQWDVVPLLPLDVWEHAYYLKHQNDRAAYVKDWWNVVNWPYVAERYAKARTLQWAPH